MNQSTKRVLFFVMAVIFLLTACAPAASAPTQDPALVQQLIQQSVALTVAAQSAQTTAAQAVVVASNTPLPTQTNSAAPSPTSLIPTATPFVIVPATNAPVSGGGGVVTTKPLYACDIIHQRPFDDTTFKPGDTFDVKWTIVNTGTKTWRKGLDLKYLSGPKMTSTASIELPEMKPGDQFNVVLDGTAPLDKGTKVMVWVIEGPICYPYVRIIVDK